MARAKATQQLRGTMAGQSGLESSLLVMPGRNLFSRRAGSFHHVERCSMCHPGRHHGAGGKKALKKSRPGSAARESWLDVVQEARRAERAGAEGGIDLAESAPQSGNPEAAEPLPPQGSAPAASAESGAMMACPPPPQVVFARAKARR